MQWNGGGGEATHSRHQDSLFDGGRGSSMCGPYQLSALPLPPHSPFPKLPISNHSSTPPALCPHEQGWLQFYSFVCEGIGAWGTNGIGSDGFGEAKDESRWATASGRPKLIIRVAHSLHIGTKNVICLVAQGKTLSVILVLGPCPMLHDLTHTHTVLACIKLCSKKLLAMVTEDSEQGDLDVWVCAAR